MTCVVVNRDISVKYNNEIMFKVLQMNDAIHYRIACRKDARELARLHYNSALKQPGAFMHLLGIKFLQAYYEILLDEGSSTILCAYRDEKKLVGFAAGAIRAESRIVALKKHRLKLFFSGFQTLISNPRLIANIRARQHASSAEDGDGFVVTSGAHMDYWAWDASGGGAIVLFKKWLRLMQLLGIQKVSGEVEEANYDVLMAHQFLGAVVTKKFRTPDGRLRNVIEYNLSTKTKSV